MNTGARLDRLTTTVRLGYRLARLAHVARAARRTELADIIDRLCLSANKR
jgi:hypothetical protein